MKKSLLAAALLTASFAAPVAFTAPAQAASSYPSHCIVLPLLKAECREAISDNTKAALTAPRVAARASVATVRDSAKSMKVMMPHWRTCERAPSGSGHLFDCN